MKKLLVTEILKILGELELSHYPNGLPETLEQLRNQTRLYNTTENILLKILCKLHNTKGFMDGATRVSNGISELYKKEVKDDN